MCSKDTVVGDVVIQRGMLVAVPIYHLHMDPSVWPDPDSFMPERYGAGSKWREEERRKWEAERKRHEKVAGD